MKGSELNVVLVYDDPAVSPRAGDLPEDFGAEYEDRRTIDALLAAIAAGGHDAAALALDCDFPQKITALGPDLVFNIAEGVRGSARESLVPAWLDQLDIPYTGSDGLAMAISLDKALTKTLAMSAGVCTPAFRRIRDEAELSDVDLPFPLFVKPNAEGSSMGIHRASLVETPRALARQVRHVLRAYREDCLVEAFAPGREFCMAILGNDPAQPLPIAEVRTEAAFYAYEDKSQHQKELLCPADVPADMAEQMQAMAVAVFEALRCRDLARVDFKLDETGQPAFLEINPLPGLSPFYSIFPHQASVAGIGYEGLIGRIVEAARQRTGCCDERIAT